MRVTLYTRVWIEMALLEQMEENNDVTLYTRVWIEIANQWFLYVYYLVTLYTRVWIEIKMTYLWTKGLPSPSTRGCGLKYFN